MAVSRRLVALVFVSLAFSASAVSWAGTNGILDLEVATTESTLPGGVAVNVVPLSSSFTYTKGAASQAAGLELYRLELGSVRYSDSMLVQLIVTNPEDMSQILGSPNAFLEVALWYEDAEGTHTLSDGTTPVSKDDASTVMLSRENAYGLLMPETPGVDTYWVLATVTIPGGGPPGGQPQGENLDFWIDVRTF